jgi:hypothetical protein
VEVFQTSDGGAVLLNRRTGQTETLKDYLATMEQANETIQQVRDLIGTLDQGKAQKMLEDEALRATKRTENVVTLPSGVTGEPPTVTTEAELLKRAQRGEPAAPPVRQTADQFYNSLRK